MGTFCQLDNCHNVRDFEFPSAQGLPDNNKTVNCPLTAGRYPLVLCRETGMAYGAWGMAIGSARQTALKQQFAPTTSLPERFRVRVGYREWLGCILHDRKHLCQLGLERHIYHDDESRYMLAFNGTAQSYFSYNTKLVKPKKFRSYWDFLDPAWKGKMVSYDPTMGGAVSGVLMFLYKNPQLGPKFIRRILTEMDLRATRDSRQLVNWLAVGKYPLAALVGPNRAGIYRAREQGLPINTFDSQLFKEGGPLSTSNGNVAFFNKSPHPNAAKVVLNWLLSREGQMAYQKFGYDKDSLRIDIPKDKVPPRVKRSEGVDYLVLAGPGFKNMEPINKIIREVWRKKR